MWQGKYSHVLQYVLLALSVFLVMVATHQVHLLTEGLIGTMFLVIVAVAALFGDYSVGVLAVVLCTLALNYTSPPFGFDHDAATILRTIEFLVAGLAIFYLAWRVRHLKTDNGRLIAAATELQGIIKKLHAESKGNQTRAKRLKEMNSNLEQLVDEFLENDEYWSRKWNPPKDK